MFLKNKTSFIMKNLYKCRKKNVLKTLERQANISFFGSFRPPQTSLICWNRRTLQNEPSQYHNMPQKFCLTRNSHEESECLSTNPIHDFIPLDAKDDKHFSILPLYLESTQMGQSSPIAPGMTLNFLTPTHLCKENQSKLPYFVCYSSKVQVGPIK